MKYSTEPFPLDNLFLDAIKKMWEQGWLDEFSKEHFLIRTINGELRDFRTKDQMDNISSDLYYRCDTPENFLINFSQKWGDIFPYVDLKTQRTLLKTSYQLEKASIAKINFLKQYMKFMY